MDTHTNASQTHKRPQPAAILTCLITTLLSKANDTGRLAACIRLCHATEYIHSHDDLTVSTTG